MCLIRKHEQLGYIEDLFGRTKTSTAVQRNRNDEELEKEENSETNQSYGIIFVFRARLTMPVPGTMNALEWNMKRKFTQAKTCDLNV